MNNYREYRETRRYVESTPKLKGGKGDPNELRVKMNSKDRPKWLKR